MFRSEKNLLFALPKCKGFSLPEVVAAVMILALASSSVLLVISRCTASAADLSRRMQAFEVARDNMEKLLASGSVKEMVEFGVSEKYPDIQWQTVVETFPEPISQRLWVQAICSADYTDTAGEVQIVELTHWLTDLTKKQLLQMADKKKKELERLAEADQLIKTVQEAAEYADVDVETIQQWADSGDLTVTEDGAYIKLYLDLYQEYDGEPPAEARMEADETYEDITGQVMLPSGVMGTGQRRRIGSQETMPSQREPGPTGPEGPTSPQFEKPFWIGPDGTPYPRSILDQMPISELIPIIFDGQPA